ncbi:DMT family transporter [Carboxylicivirga mesophila]|uniref:DMT family transporter n=1 Tax=Carboxylicivirga mesophila TaxID=1166478 RepID=A0ABS5KF01_9BACT|nr:DMT family transporter [Carboxylicivirga mesophila]MBS2213484.1 DMT family transporter [Carboxylicivirga mesophila]
MPVQPSTFKAYAALFAGLIIIGFSAILIKSAEAPGIVTAFYRVGLASVVLLLPLISRWRQVHQLSLKALLMPVLGGIAFGVDTGLWSWAIEISNATIPTLMANLAPVWVGLGAVFIFKERQSKGFWFGLAVTIAGMFMMAARSWYVKDGLIAGITISIIAGIFYGIYHLFTQQGRSHMSTLLYLSISSMAAAVTTGIAVIISPYSFTGYSNTTWLIWLVYGIGVHVGGWALINYSQGHLKATTVSPTLLGQPVITAIAAFFILDEALTSWQIIGGIIVIGGIYLVNITRLKR